MRKQKQGGAAYLSTIALILGLAAADLAAAQGQGTAPAGDREAMASNNVPGAGTSASAATSSSASAQPPAATQGLSDIIVTAERRSESVQRTPLAISAIDGDALRSQQTVNIESLSAVIPNVTFGRAGGDARIFIRGVGLDSTSPGADGRVAVYIDGVYNARPQAALASFYDIDRVEVLRGPQGTLYGRNATAGAVNIISRDPTPDFEGYGTLTVGNYGLVREEGAVSGPLSDSISGRIAFQFSDRDGYGKNIESNEPVDDEHTRSVRGKLKAVLSDKLDVILGADYHREKDHNYGYRFISNTPGNSLVDEQYGYFPPKNIRDTAGFGPRSYLESYGSSVTANLDMGVVKATSISAYRHFVEAVDTNSTGTAAPFFLLRLNENAEQLSQELRFSATAGPVDLLVGGYFFHERNFASLVGGLAGFLVGLPTQQLLQGQYLGGTQSTNAYAAFAQATWHITDNWGLDVGERFSDERRSLNEFFQLDLVRPYSPDNPVLSGFISPIQFFSQQSQSHSWRSFDPKFTLHDQITPTVLAYLTYSRGFKSGGFNFGGFQPPFNPERLTNYEAGLKADLLDRRLRANISGFYYQYENLQVNITEGVRLLTENAAKAKLYGAEVELTALPVDDLRFGLNLSYLHSEFQQYRTVDPANLALGIQSLTGNQLSYAPNYKIDAEGGYTFHAAVGDLTPRANVTWTSRTYFESFNHGYASQAPHAEVNLFLDFARSSGWSATAYVRNLTSDVVLASGTIASSIFGSPFLGQIAAPRTFGVAITKKF